jgi:hypothetical protein
MPPDADHTDVFGLGHSAPLTWRSPAVINIAPATAVLFSKIRLRGLRAGLTGQAFFRERRECVLVRSTQRPA